MCASPVIAIIDDEEHVREAVARLIESLGYRAEVYASGIVTLPLQQTNALDRLHAMNQAIGNYSDSLRKASAHPEAFVALEPMPGNSFDAKNTSVCWK